MGTSLYAITNVKTLENFSDEHLNKKLKELKALNFPPSRFASDTDKEHAARKHLDWSYQKYNENGFLEIEFDSDTNYTITLLPNIAVISTIYRYSFLYRAYDNKWLHQFRKDLYNIINIFGSSELIYLADSSASKLSNYLYDLAFENKSYKVIKQKMIQELGQPVTDYSKLEYDKLSYSNITEFFLDDFKNVFKEELVTIGAEGGGFTIFKNINELNETIYYHTTIESTYDLDEEIIINKTKPKEFSNFLDAFYNLKIKYKSLFMFYPLYVNFEVKKDVTECLELEFKNKEKDHIYKMWLECLDE